VLCIAALILYLHSDLDQGKQKEVVNNVWLDIFLQEFMCW
jgi:hypothetical protein